MLVRLALRWRRSAPLERLQLTPVYACGLLALPSSSPPPRARATALWWAAFVATAVLPYAFLAGLLRSHVARLDAELRARLRSCGPRAPALVEAGDTERRRLERDLHDGAQARLVGLAVLLGQLRRRLSADPAATALLDQAQAELRTSLAELRELARGIHPALLTDRGLEPALDALVARAPMRVTLEADEGERLPAAVEIAAYYVVSEALTNVAKYAHATAASVDVRRTGACLRIDVADDGVGGADAGRGSGLRGLADRVAALDGTLTLDSPPGLGTRLRVDIPLPAAGDGPAAPRYAAGASVMPRSARSASGEAAVGPGSRAPEHVALAVADAERGQRGEVVAALDALGADVGAGAPGEGDEALDQRGAHRVGGDAVDEAAVELDDVGPHAHELLQAGVARARVVDRDQRAAAAEVVEQARRAPARPPSRSR